MALQELIDRGYGLCRIRPGEKRPVGIAWQLHPIRDVRSFATDDAVGIVCGPLSRDVVCIDLDGIDTALSDQMLPPTDMEDGRPGRERAHRWYRLLDEWWPDSVLPQPGTDTLVAMSAGQLPRFCGSRNLRAAHDRTIGIELKGCGTQATVPPTMTGHGPRAWRGGLLGEPACVEYLEIMSAVERLAGAIGWHGAASQPLPKRCQTIDREDWQVLARAQKARNGARFDAMWNATSATSEQDAALVRMLAFWTQDAAQLERLWLQSPCGQRPKTQGREDYRRRTIAFVLRGCHGG